MAEEKKKFSEAVKAAGMKPASMQKLAEDDFDTISAIKAMTDDDVRSVNLTRGQTRLLESRIKALNKPAVSASDNGTPVETTPPGNASIQNGPGSSTQQIDNPSLSNNAELQRLLAQLDANGTLGDSIFGGNSTGVLDPHDKRHPGSKALLIPDYVTQPDRGGHDGEETEVCDRGDTKLVIRAKRQKPRVENVTLGQWISANARIMCQLISEDKLSSKESLLDYLQYIQDFGDYAQVCEHSSLMIYDQEFRKKQATKGTSWGTNDIHLSTFYLQRRTQKTHGSRSRTTEKPPRLSDDRGHEVCRNFNNNSCFRDNCRYSHVCSVCKDSGHSRIDHK